MVPRQLMHVELSLALAAAGSPGAPDPPGVQPLGIPPFNLGTKEEP